MNKMTTGVTTYLVWARARVLMMTDFPPPVGPTTIVVCLVIIVSYNCTTLSAYNMNIDRSMHT